MTSTRKLTLAFAILAMAAGCQSVDVTKTAKGYYAPTDPNDVDILFTKPDKSYTELGSLTVTGFAPSDTAKMHNAIRAKAAPLGANAAIIVSSGIVMDPNVGPLQWCMAVAIKFN